MATKQEKAKTQTDESIAILLNKTFETSKGQLKVIVDYRTYLADVEDYTNKLIRLRNIPFDLNAIPIGDAKVIEASQKFDYIEDENEVLEMVRKFYESEIAQVRTHAMILAQTRKTPNVLFDPEPYPDPEQREEWDNDLDPIVPNLQIPLEKRLKQMIDMISDSAEVMREFYASMQTMMITVERKAREVDKDGFRSGRANGDTNASPVSDSVQPKT